MFRRLVLTVVTVSATALGGLVVQPATAADPPTTLRFACALKSSGLLRAVTALSQCTTKKETAVTFGVAAPVTVCFKPDTTVRLGRCTTAGTTATIPSNTPRYFCTDTAPANRILKWVSSPTLCASGTLAFVVGNSAPTALALTPSSVAENEPVGTTVGTLSATDPDVGDTFTFALVSGVGSSDNSSFQITGSTLKTNAVFDFEAASSYSIRLRVTDRLGLTLERPFTIAVTDVGENSAPTDISLSGTTVAEDEPVATTIGTLSASDPDAGDTHTFALVSGAGDTDNASFQISGSTLQTNAVFDFETKSSYTIRVRATDSGNSTFEKSFTITTTDVNEPPTDVSLSGASVDEGKPVATTIGTLSASDPDAGDTHTFALVPGAGDTDNASFQISGSTLQTNAVFDFETKSSYTIRVRVTDSGNSTFEKQLTITITNDPADDNAPPTDISLSPSSVDENEPIGTAVGTLSTTDPNAADTHTYSLVAGTGDDDNGSFQVDGSTLETNAELDFEVRSTFQVRLQTDDGRGGTFQKQFIITINDANDPPVATADSYGNAVGNTFAVLGTTGSGPHVVLTGEVLTDNDTDEDVPAQPLSVVAETVLTTGGGAASISADGSFTYLPGVGDKNQNDTFTYHVTDGISTTAGTVTIAIADALVWYVDDSAAAGDGRSNAPFSSLASVNGAGGAGDPDASGDIFFLYSGSYGGGLVMEVNQRLVGEPQGLTVNPGGGNVSLVSAGGTNPVIGNTGGPGITLANGVSIQRIRVSGTSADGIVGSGVTGTVSIAGTTVDGYGNNGLNITNGSGALTLTVTGSTFKNASVAGNADGVHLDANGTAAITASITGSTFDNNRGDHFQFATDATSLGTNSVTFSNNTLTGDRGSVFGGDDLGGGIVLTTNASSVTAFTIAGNSIQGSVSTTIAVVAGSATTAGGSLSGTINGNTIGSATVEGSGGSQGSGISLQSGGAGTFTVAATNNSIQKNRGPAAIDVLGARGSSKMNATVTGNTVGPSLGYGLFLSSGEAAGDAGTTCAAISGNTLAGSGAVPNTDFRLRQRLATTVQLPGYVGTAGNTTAVVAFVQGNNPGAETGSATVDFPGSGGGFVNVASCTAP